MNDARRALPDDPRRPLAIDYGRAAVTERLAWWTAGAPGHWPHCPCGKHPPPPAPITVQTGGNL